MSRGSAHARMAARAAAVRREGRRRAAVIIGALLVVAVLAWGVGFGPWLVVRDVQVSGGDGSVAKQAQQIADAERGTPIVRAHLSQVQQRIAALPQVAQVQVSRDLPSGIQVRLRERVPVLAVVRADSRTTLVDESGVAFQTVTKVPSGVPQVRLNSASRTSGAGVAALAKVLDALPAATRRQVHDVKVTATGQVSFSVGERQVAWGDATRSPEKATSLAAMLPTVKGQSGALDLSDPDRPVLTKG